MLTQHHPTYHPLAFVRRLFCHSVQDQHWFFPAHVATSMCYRYQHSNDPYDNMHAKIHSMTTCMHFNSMHESSPQGNEWTCMKKGRQWAIMHGKAMCGHACQERACMYGHWPKVRFLTTYHQNWICMFMSADGHAWSWHECGHAMSCMQTHTRTHVHMSPTQPGALVFATSHNIMQFTGVTSPYTMCQAFSSEKRWGQLCT